MSSVFIFSSLANNYGFNVTKIFDEKKIQKKKKIEIKKEMISQFPLNVVIMYLAIQFIKVEDQQNLPKLY